MSCKCQHHHDLLVETSTITEQPLDIPSILYSAVTPTIHSTSRHCIAGILNIVYNEFEICAELIFAHQYNTNNIISTSTKPAAI